MNTQAGQPQTGEIDRKAFLSLVEAFNQESGVKVSRVTAWRYTVKGLCGVLLKRWYISGRWWTNREAVREFLDEVERVKNGETNGR